MDQIKEVENSEESSSNYSFDGAHKWWDPYTLNNIYEDLEQRGSDRGNKSAIQLNHYSDNFEEVDYFKKSKSWNLVGWKKTADIYRKNIPNSSGK